jgi:molybdate transport system ATP-binding protein
MDDALIELREVDVALGGHRVLRGISWQLRCGQHWMIHGPNGSGKSTFLRLLRGEVWPAPNRGERLYRLDGATQMTAIEVRRHITLVSPETQERYLQQEWRMTARDVIHTGFAQSDLLYVKLTRAQSRRVETLAKELRIEPLMDRNMQSLSTGELRKVLIARAVVGHPAVLLLDEVCDGLDAAFRTGLLHMVETIARHGTQIVYTTHRADEPLSVITHELRFKDGRAERGRSVRVPKQRAARVPLASLHPRRQRDAGGTLIQIENAEVFLDRTKVLQGIHWQLRRGEHWAVLGGNGAGKTTFLKLIASDLYPAFGSRVARFELKADNTIWDLRRRIGCVSPLLQTHYREQVTGEEVVASGFFSSIGLMEKPFASQLRRARALLNEFGLSHLRAQSMLAMSFGDLRKVLTLRALVHEPELLIFDEPFDGLDAGSRRDFRVALERIAARGTQLVVVTHHLDDLPHCITHGLFLESGRIAVAGEWPAIRGHANVVALFGTGGATLSAQQDASTP